MVSYRSLCRAACATFLAASCGGAVAQQAPPAQQGGAEAGATLDTIPASYSYAAMAENKWRVEFNSWIWLTGVTGEVGVGGLKSDINADFGDILEASDSLFAFSGHLEVGYGRLAGYIDAWYANIGAEDLSGPAGQARVDLTNEEFIADVGLMYRLGEWTPEGEAEANIRNITLDAYAGARFTSVSLELDPANAEPRSRSKDWVDPIVGAKVVLPFSQSWHFMLNGDVGGFGAASDFTWSVTGVFGYDFVMLGMPATLYAGYRALGQDYSDDSGTREFSWDVVQHGPMLGLALRF